MGNGQWTALRIELRYAQLIIPKAKHKSEKMKYEAK